MAAEKLQPQQNVAPMIHHSTKNISFWNTHVLLEQLGVANNDFFLILYDHRLKDIDPHDPNLNKKEMRWARDAILEECKINPWYVIRECIRVQVQGGGSSHFFLDMASLSSFFLSMLNFNYAVIKPRQTGKTLGEAIWDAICINFYYRQSKMGLITISTKLVNKNVAQIIDILDMLPSYLRYHNYALDKNNNYVPRRKDSVKKTTYGHLINRNHIIGAISGVTREQAENCGRGESFVSIWFDEPAHMKFNHLAIGSAMRTFSKVSAIARKTGTPHKISFTLTPGDTLTPHGQYMYNLLENECAVFTPKLFDYSLEDLRKYLRINGERDIFKIQYSYQELGYDEDWLQEQKRTSTDEREFRMGVLLEWYKDLSKNPFGIDILNNLKRVTETVKSREFIFQKNFMFKMYPGFDIALMENRKIVVGVDVAAGRGGKKDSSTMVGIDPVTTEVLFTFKNNVIDPDTFADLIRDFVVNIIPNSLIVVERNNIGSGVLSKLKKSDIIDNLYYTPLSKQQLDDLEVADKEGKYIFGIWNHHQFRDVIYGEIINTRVTQYAKLIKSQDIYNEILTLIDKGGRIDHALDCHDDLVIGWLLALFVLFKDNTIHEKFGIGRPIPVKDIVEFEEDLAIKRDNPSVLAMRDLIIINKDKGEKSSNKNAFEKFYKAHREATVKNVIEDIKKEFGVSPTKVEDKPPEGLMNIVVKKRR